MKVLKRVLFFDIIHIYYWVIYSCDKKLNKIKSLYEITLEDVNKLMDSTQYTEIPATDEKIMILKIIVKKHINLVNKINDMFFVVKLKK